MTIARSVAQGQFEIEYENIAAKRNREAGLMVWVDCVSAISTALVLMDVFSLFGFSMAMVFTFSLTALAFFAPLLIALGCGIICAVFIVSDSENRRDTELEQMEACAELIKTQVEEFKVIAKLLERLLSTKFLSENEKVFIRERYQAIIQNDGDDLSNVILEIKGCLKVKMEGRLEDMALPRMPEHETKNVGKIKIPLHGLAKLIAFFSGVGFMWGISASVLGGAALPVLLLTPAGWTVLGGALILSVIIGVASCVDYKCRLSQQEHMDDLISEEKTLKATSTHLRDISKYLDWALDVSRPAEIAADIVGVTRENELSLDAFFRETFFASGERAVNDDQVLSNEEGENSFAPAPQ